MTRPSTPDERYQDEDGHWVTRFTVKRCCNGCSRDLGDATEHELDCAVDGLPLPDVREECGCLDAAGRIGGGW